MIESFPPDAVNRDLPFRIGPQQPALAPTHAVHTLAHRQPGEPLWPEDHDLILKLDEQGWTQPQIAKHLGCDQATVCRSLQKHKYSSVELAKRRAANAAYRSVERAIDIVEKGKDDDALKAAKTVLTVSGAFPTGSGVSVGVKIVYGQPGSSALDAAAITVTQGNHNDGYQTQRESVGLTGQQVTGAINVASEAKGGGER